MSVCCGQHVAGLHSMLRMQVAALMSGKTRVGLADLHRVCAHWLQAAETPPAGLQAFGCQDLHAAQARIAKTLRYRPVPLPVHTRKVTHAGIMKEDLNASWPQLIVASHCSLLYFLTFVAQPYVEEYHAVPCVT